jgi:hypothetical protein
MLLALLLTAALVLISCAGSGSGGDQESGTVASLKKACKA